MTVKRYVTRTLLSRSHSASEVHWHEHVYNRKHDLDCTSDHDRTRAPINTVLIWTIRVSAGI